MNRLDYATEVIELAKELGVGGVTPVENILGNGLLQARGRRVLPCLPSTDVH